MKRILGVALVVIVLILGSVAPASAASLGISPSKIDIEVPQGGSTPVNFQVHYFSGELRVSLVDIPLEVEPKVFHITSSPEDIIVTFHDNTFDPQEYNGYVRFLSTGNATVGLAVNIVAKVTVVLSANIVEKPTPPPPRGEPGPPTYHTKTDLFGVGKNYRISRTGEILKTIEATSADGMLTVTIPKGTVALGKDGKRLKSLQVVVDETPPSPPSDAHIIGLAYNFGPDGASFDPPITFIWSYDPEALPEDVAEKNLVLAYYDQAVGKWVELDYVVDTENNTITASVGHFTTFAVIGTVTPPPPPPPPAPAAFSVSNLSIQPAEVQPKELVTITVSVVNTGGTEGSYSVLLLINRVKEAEKSVTIAAGQSQVVSFSLAEEEAGSYSVVVDGLTASFSVVAPPVPAPPPPPPPPVPEPEVKPPFPWPLVGGIIGGVVIVGLLVFFLVVRRRASPLPQGEGD